MSIRKNTMKKPDRAINEIQGNSHPKAAALNMVLECVSGKQYNIAWAVPGRFSNAKNVPHRNVIGKMTKALNVAMF